MLSHDPLQLRKAAFAGSFGWPKALKEGCMLATALGLACGCRYLWRASARGAYGFACRRGDFQARGCDPSRPVAARRATGDRTPWRAEGLLEGKRILGLRAFDLVIEVGHALDLRLVAPKAAGRLGFHVVLDLAAPEDCLEGNRFARMDFSSCSLEVPDGIARAGDR